ncbi:MAG: hypothetical protein JXR95_03515 [Deltaproteobacteria bacterium]|nr:hypothetical protein [Deltaproteobacteria bacterium]
MDEAEFREKHEKFMEDFALIFEEYGIPRMAGRIYACLLTSDPPYLTAKELTSQTGGSKGSINTITRNMLAIGVLEKVAVPGSRSSYFTIADPCLIGVLKRKIEHIRKMRNLLEQGIELFKDRNNNINNIFEQHIKFNHFTEKAIESIIDNWIMENT